MEDGEACWSEFFAKDSVRPTAELKYFTYLARCEHIGQVCEP